MVIATAIFIISALIFLAATIYGIFMLRKVRAEYERSKPIDHEPR